MDGGVVLKNRDVTVPSRDCAGGASSVAWEPIEDGVDDEAETFGETCGCLGDFVNRRLSNGDFRAARLSSASMSDIPLNPVGTCW